MGPWIHVLSIVAVDQTDMNQGFSLVEEVLPWITDMAWGRVGARWGRAAPRWHRPALAYGPMVPCHVHISCIQIILQAQVELGEI
jgi:hypothetical protein